MLLRQRFHRCFYNVIALDSIRRGRILDEEAAVSKLFLSRLLLQSASSTLLSPLSAASTPLSASQGALKAAAYIAVAYHQHGSMDPLRAS
jgi:hypothetical protein